MRMINTNHSAAPVGTTERVRLVPPISAAQGSGLPFVGYVGTASAGNVTAFTTDMTLGAVRKAGTRVPARGRPL